MYYVNVFFSNATITTYYEEDERNAKAIFDELCRVMDEKPNDLIQIKGQWHTGVIRISEIVHIEFTSQERILRRNATMNKMHDQYVDKIKKDMGLEPDVGFKAPR